MILKMSLGYIRFEGPTQDIAVTFNRKDDWVEKTFSFLAEKLVPDKNIFMKKIGQIMDFMESFEDREFGGNFVEFNLSLSIPQNPEDDMILRRGKEFIDMTDLLVPDDKGYMYTKNPAIVVSFRKESVNRIFYSETSKEDLETCYERIGVRSEKILEIMKKHVEEFVNYTGRTSVLYRFTDFEMLVSLFCTGIIDDMTDEDGENIRGIVAMRKNGTRLSVFKPKVEEKTASTKMLGMNWKELPVEIPMMTICLLHRETIAVRHTTINAFKDDVEKRIYNDIKITIGNQFEIFKRSSLNMSFDSPEMREFVLQCYKSFTENPCPQVSTMKKFGKITIITRLYNGEPVKYDAYDNIAFDILIARSFEKDIPSLVKKLNTSGGPDSRGNLVAQKAMRK